MTITTEEAEVLVGRMTKHVRDRSGPALTNGAWAMMLEAGEALRTLTAERDRLREAFRAEREENLWNAFNIGSIRSDGKWIDCGLSDAEWLVCELGLDEDAYGHDPEEIKRRIPEAASRAALEGGDNPDQPNEALKALYARGKAMRADAALALGPTP